MCVCSCVSECAVGGQHGAADALSDLVIKLSLFTGPHCVTYALFFQHDRPDQSAFSANLSICVKSIAMMYGLDIDEKSELSE